MTHPPDFFLDGRSRELLDHTALFDSDYPLIAPDRWLEDFEKIAIRDNVRPLILKENAMRLFGLA